MRGACTLLLGILATAGLATQAVAGPDWVEGAGTGPGGNQDAGSLPSDDQTTEGLGGINSISGRITGFGIGANGEEDDLEDMYQIIILDPENFSASTAAGTGGYADFDSKIVLFKEDGLGLLANDNAGDELGGLLFECPLDLDINGVTDVLDLMALLAEWGPNPGSPADANDDDVVGVVDLLILLETWGECPPAGAEIGNAANDGTGAEILEPGLYRLAITLKEREPRSPPGAIFILETETEVSGPDGPGGMQMITEWDMVEDDPQQGGQLGEGDYKIVITGAGFAEAPPAGDVSIDVWPGFCPNYFLPILTPIAIVGNDDVDVSLIDVETLQVSRADGVGTGVSPFFAFAHDLTAPFDGELCDCSEDGPDGTDDLLLKFFSLELAIELELFEFPDPDNAGSEEDFEDIELVITGEYINGGAFEGRDCIRVYAPSGGKN